MTADNPNEASVVRHSAALHVFLWTAFPLLGGIAGWLVSELPGWVERLPWAPNQDQIADLAGVIGSTTTIVLVVLGVIAGCVVALMAYDDIVTVEVTGEAVRISRSGDTKACERPQVAAAFVDGKHLVLLGPDTGELAREKTDHHARKLRSAFEAHDYPWREGDPHAADFARWFDGMPGLSPHANAVLRTRQHAVESDDTADVADLHGELVKLGIVVRDEKKRQYWRAIRSSAD